MDAERLEILAQVAVWYYEEDLSLGDIAKRLNRSVSLVSRMLQEARDQNLVEIRIRYPNPRDGVLETRLREVFDVREAWVLSRLADGNDMNLHSRLGNLGAACLGGMLHEGVKIGCGWGTSVYEVVRALDYHLLPDTQVIQVSGATGSHDPTVDGAQVAQQLASKLGTQPQFLHAPLIVAQEETAVQLRADPVVAGTLQRAGDVDIAIVSVGSPYTPNGGLRRAGYLSEEDVAVLEKRGVVGDIIGFHFDQGGVILDIPLNQRIIGLMPQQLLDVPTVILVARGLEKTRSIQAALRGHYIDILVTDTPTALSLLENTQV